TRRRRSGARWRSKGAARCAAARSPSASAGDARSPCARAATTSPSPASRSTAATSCSSRSSAPRRNLLALLREELIELVGQLLAAAFELREPLSRRLEVLARDQARGAQGLLLHLVQGPLGLL